MDPKLRIQVFERASHRCEYCQLPASCDSLPQQVDHIIAEKHHGKTMLDNLAASCFDCNAYKGPNISGIDPLTGELTRLVNPRTDAWSEHFHWDEQTRLVGDTPEGRATIDVLDINQTARLAHRRLLIAAGLFQVISIDDS